MSHSKVQDHGTAGSEKEDILNDLVTHGHGNHLGHGLVM